MAAALLLLLQNNTDRGWVLKGVEEITQLLEDMGLNLQSMMASPHVRPFAEEVRMWEQRLSLIGECIEVGAIKNTNASTIPLGCMSNSILRHWLQLLAVMTVSPTADASQAAQHAKVIL